MLDPSNIYKSSTIGYHLYITTWHKKTISLVFGERKFLLDSSFKVSFDKQKYWNCLILTNCKIWVKKTINQGNKNRTIQSHSWYTKF